MRIIFFSDDITAPTIVMRSLSYNLSCELGGCYSPHEIISDKRAYRLEEADEVSDLVVIFEDNMMFLQDPVKEAAELANRMADFFQPKPVLWVKMGDNLPTEDLPVHSNISYFDIDQICGNHSLIDLLAQKIRELCAASDTASKQ